jgi:hypothetical protein
MFHLHHLHFTGIGTYLWCQGEIGSRRSLLVGCRRGIVRSSTWLRAFPFPPLVCRSLWFWGHTQTGDNRTVTTKQLVLLKWQLKKMPLQHEWQVSGGMKNDLTLQQRTDLYRNKPLKIYKTERSHCDPLPNVLLFSWSPIHMSLLQHCTKFPQLHHVIRIKKKM